MTDAGSSEQDFCEVRNHSELCSARITKAMEGNEEGREKIRRETEMIARQAQAKEEGKGNQPDHDMEARGGQSSPHCEQVPDASGAGTKEQAGGAE